MADLGVIGTLGNKTTRANGLSIPRFFKRIMCADTPFYYGNKNTTEGDASQPCLELKGPGMWRFRWAFASGTRTISINVKQPDNVSPRPTLVVKANPDCGVNADVTATAGAGAGWVTIGPATITPSSNGAVWVELRANYEAQAESFWDKVVVT